MSPFSWWKIISCECDVRLTPTCWFTNISQYF